MSSIAALLRGINVGGKNRVSMKELRDILAMLGYDEVRTHGQSGNVVFESPKGDLNDIAAQIERAIAKTFDLDVGVILRTGEELAKIATSHPLSAEGIEPSKLHLVFLRKAPSAERVTKLDPHSSPPDRFEVDGREIYVLYPNGAGRSKLSIDYFERLLGITGTARNWNTVTRLRDLTAG